MKSITTGSSSPEDRRHLRGVLGLLVVLVVMLGGDFVLFWKLGGFEDYESLSKAGRGLACILAAQLTFAAWVYRRLSARSSTET